MMLANEFSENAWNSTRLEWSHAMLLKTKRTYPSQLTISIQLKCHKNELNRVEFLNRSLLSLTLLNCLFFLCANKPFVFFKQHAPATLWDLRASHVTTRAVSALAKKVWRVWPVTDVLEATNRVGRTSHRALVSTLQRSPPRLVVISFNNCFANYRTSCNQYEYAAKHSTRVLLQRSNWCQTEVKRWWVSFVYLVIPLSKPPQNVFHIKISHYKSNKKVSFFFRSLFFDIVKRGSKKDNYFDIITAAFY